MPTIDLSGAGPLAPFLQSNPGFDILGANLLDPAAVDALNWAGSDRGGALAALRGYQRLLRVAPDAATAHVLMAHGIGSAQQITAQSEQQFVAAYAPLLGDGGAGKAQDAYRRAGEVRLRAMHLLATVHGTVASPHARALTAAGVSPDLAAAFEKLPSYQDMFGPLKYCPCGHDDSIFSPAAYFADLMRIIDKYVTGPNKATIDAVDAALELGARRPDLEKIPLTSAMTNDLVPMLQVVREVLENTIAAELKVADAEKAVADGTLAYPFGLPVNLPQQRIRGYLASLRADTATVFAALGLSDFDVFYERMGLSSELYTLLTTPTVAPADLERYYGRDVSGPTLGGLTDPELFGRVAGLDAGGVRELFRQDLLPLELGEDAANPIPSLAAGFFINAGGQPVRLVTTDGGGTLQDLTPASLDRIHRFVRLARLLGWSLTDLDWVIRSLGYADLLKTSDAIPSLGKVQYAAERYGMPLDVLSALWHDLKTVGVGDPASPRDLFDRVFNDPLSVRADAVYHPAYAPNPLFTDPVVTLDLAVADAPGSRFPRTRLLSGLGVNQATLNAMVQALFAGKVPLTVPNLSVLYRVATLLSRLGLGMDEYRVLLSHLGISDLTTLSIDQFLKVMELADWLGASGFTVYELDYVVNGTPDPTLATNGAPQAAFAAFLQSLWTLAAPSLLAPDALVRAGFSAGDAVSLLRQLAGPGFTWPVGAAYAAAGLTPRSPDAALVLDAAVAAGASLASLTVPAGKGTRPLGGDEQAALAQALRRAHQAQHELLDRQTGTFLGTGAALAGALLALGGRVAGTADPFVVLMTPAPLAPDAAAAASGSAAGALLAAVRRMQRMAARLALTPTEVAGVTAHPVQMGVADLAHPRLADLRNLYRFRQLVRSLGDTQDLLLSCLGMPAGGGPCGKDPRSAALAALTGWGRDRICAVVAALGSGEAGYTTAPGIAQLADCFDLMRRTGTDPAFLVDLAAMRAVPAAGSSPVGSSADPVPNWDRWRQLEARTMDVVRARYPDDQWPAVRQAIQAPLLEQARDALNGLALWALGRHYPGVTTLRQVTELLLIDVETGGGIQISYIKQALLSAQMYLQRCRLGLEPGVTVLTVPDTWWEWIMSYRVWEANRKVFLYPENYLDPSLRADKTELFQALENDLLQGSVTKDAVEAAYTRYFDGFAAVARLRPAGAYRCLYHDPASPDPVDTLFFFGRTATEPYTYYYRRWIQPDADRPVWTAWEKIDLKIDAEYITPVYAFNRLFLFWVGTHRVTVNNGSRREFTDRATIRYSFYDFRKKWAPPQTMVDGLVVKFRPYDDPLTFGQISPVFDLDRMVWRRVLAVEAPASSFASAGPALQATDRILVLYGAFFKTLPSGVMTVPTAPPDKDTDNPDELAFFQTVQQTAKLNEEVAATTRASPGFIGTNRLFALDEDMQVNESRVYLMDHFWGSPSEHPFMASVAAADHSLNVNVSTNLVWDSYLGDSAAGSPGGTDAYDNRGGDVSVPQLTLLPNIDARNAGVQPVKNQPGYFVFDNGDELFLVHPDGNDFKQVSQVLSVHENFMQKADPPITALMCTDYTQKPKGSFAEFKFRFHRLSTGAIKHLSRTLFAEGIDGLLDTSSQQPVAAPQLPFSRFYAAGGAQPPAVLSPAVADGGTVDFDGAYGPYFWEVFFQAPFLIADRLNTNQQFAEAKRWYEYVFNPTRPDSTGLPPGAPATLRYWRFQPFRMQVKLESLLAILGADNSQEIQAYHDDPFDPHAIARLRIGAYEKAVVMKYVDNLLDWGDYTFGEYTWESITQATTLYLLAYDLLGTRPKPVAACTRPHKAATYADVRATYHDKVPEFLLDLENLLPPSGAQLSPDAPYNDIPAYFCVPDNAQLAAYWDRVEDRLFKIRHGLNLAGVRQPLPLFEPPIDPMQLVRAAAAGNLSLAALAQGAPAVPNYRFTAMLERARGITSTLVQLGAALLAALEKQDAEQLSLLRSTHEQAVLQLTTTVLQREIDDAQAAVAALQQSLVSAQFRSTYYQKLVSSGLSGHELATLTLMAEALVFQSASIVIHGVSVGGYLAPNIFGLADGGMQWGDAVSAAAQLSDGIAAVMNQGATLATDMGQFDRRTEEWRFQQQLADDDAAQIQQQITAATARTAVAQQQLSIHLREMEQARDVDDFLRGKFTSQELYQWMVDRLSVVYFQTYGLALDMAMAAQRGYQFELNTDESYINFNYWDSLRKGLLAGEALTMALGQLEKAYLDGNARTLEIEKTVSLLQLDPLALLDLKSRGRCTFQLGERLFDQDFPGHYARQIHSVSVAIPAVVGPYQNIRATLTQTLNRTVVQPSPDAVKYLLGVVPDVPDASHLRVNWRGSQQVALSRGAGDSGLFELSAGDERYLPFEGTGAVSEWELSLPPAANRFDFAAISDVIFTLRYTALADQALHDAVVGLAPVQAYDGARYFSLSQAYAPAWQAFMASRGSATSQKLAFQVPVGVVPPHVGGARLVKALVRLVVAPGTDMSAASSFLTLTIGAQEATPLTLSADNVATVDLSKKPLPLAQFATGWVLDVDPTRVPGLQGSDQFLDPARLLNLELVLSYTGTLDWTAG